MCTDSHHSLPLVNHSVKLLIGEECAFLSFSMCVCKNLCVYVTWVGLTAVAMGTVNTRALGDAPLSVVTPSLRVSTPSVVLYPADTDHSLQISGSAVF